MWWGKEVYGLVTILAPSFGFKVGSCWAGQTILASKCHSSIYLFCKMHKYLFKETLRPIYYSKAWWQQVEGKIKISESWLYITNKFNYWWEYEDQINWMVIYLCYVVVCKTQPNKENK